MSIIQWLHKKTAPKIPKITDEMRQQADLQKRINSALKQKEKQVEILEKIMKIDPSSQPKTTMDTLLETLLPIILAKLTNEGSIQSPIFPENGVKTPTLIGSGVEGKILSKEEIGLLVNSDPKNKAIAKQMTNEQLKEFIMKKDSSLSSDTIKNIIMEVRT